MIKSLPKSVFWSSMILLIISLFLGAFTFAWFSLNRDAASGGMSMGIEGASPIIIRNAYDGEDIGVDVIDKNTVHIKVVLDDSEYSTIQPGTSGRFTFYLESNTTSHQDLCTFHYCLQIVNNAFHTADSGATYTGEAGFFSGKTDKNKSDALAYINSHLLMFNSLSAEGIYSGWIPSGVIQTEPDFQETEKYYVYAKTVYWIWILDYDTLIEGDLPIHSDDVAAIQAYYESAEHKNEMFFGGEIGEDGYNEADYSIGTTLQYICFELYAY